MALCLDGLKKEWATFPLESFVNHFSDTHCWKKENDAVRQLDGVPTKFTYIRIKLFTFALIFTDVSAYVMLEANAITF